MKKAFLAIFLLLFVLSATLLTVGACRNSEPVVVEFSQKEYEIHSGDKVSVKNGKVTYSLATKVDGVVIDEVSGEITVSKDVPDCTQVVVLAKVDGKVVAGVVCTLHTATAKPNLAFDALTDYVVNGDTVHAVSTPAYSVLYSLKKEYGGISINSVTGKVSYTASVLDGTEFVVVATAKDTAVEHTFKTVVGNTVSAVDTAQVSEYLVGSDVSFKLDFADNPEAQNVGVLQVMYGRNALTEKQWTYDKTNCALTIDKSVVKDMPMGDNTIKIVTYKNSVNVSVNVAVYLATAEEIAAINDSREALQGNYILACDIDLTEYLSKGGKGYNGGKGWNPIGVYHDVTDGTATDFAFAGTFDGNGHTIYGFFIDRIDEFAYNSGFFGYISSRGKVRNLGIRNGVGKVNSVRSYSGGFAGVNAGTISDCWADVDVVTGDVFKVVGGFVGRNEGEIINCYSLGKVSGGSSVGCFAGVAQTPITFGTFSNCYAVKTENYPFSDVFDSSNALFDTKADVATADFSTYKDAWNVKTGELPKLKSVALEYGLREIKITNTATKFTRGDVVEIDVVINPVGIIDELELKYEVLEGDAMCLVVDGNAARVETRQFSDGDSHFKIQVSCGEMVDVYEFDVYERVKTVQFDSTMETILHAGTSYYLDVTVDPEGSDQTVTFSFLQELAGVTLSNGIVTVDPYVENGNVAIVVTTVNGKTATLNAQVVATKVFPNNSRVVYRGEDETVSFVLPSGVAAQLTNVTRHDKDIPFTVSGDTVTMDSKYFVDFGTREVPVKFVTDNDIYRATVFAYNRADVVEIGSVEEFLTFKSDRDLYDKVIVLTADLDFGGATLTALGSHHLGWDFTGVFNGNGHTISNLNIDRNDFSGEYDVTGEEAVEGQDTHRGDENTYKYHASRFNVGFFSYLTGSITNVNFVNVHVASYFEGEVNGNFVGVIAGTVSGGTVSHCTFTNCSAKAGGSEVGIICGKFTNALAIDCVVDGNLTYA